MSRRPLATMLACVAALGAWVAVPVAAATPPPDPQSVVVRVPAPTGTDTPIPAPTCPELGREDFVYDLGSTAGTTVSIADWTTPTRLDVADAPTRVTISLAAGVELPESAACRYPFTLASYRTEGATWPTSGAATLVDLSTGVVETGASRLSLVVPLAGCFAQVELYLGTERYEAGAGAAPSYPDPIPPGVSIASWNGDRDCTGPGVVADLSVVAVPPCPQDAVVTWLVVNPNGRAVEAALVTEGQAVTWTGTVMAVPGGTPVVVATGPSPPAALVATWVDSSGGSRSARSTTPVALQPGSPEHAARCASPPADGVAVIKTAVPPPGDPVVPGEAITWTVTVVNRGEVALSQVEVLDVVPAYVRVTDAQGAATIGDRLSWLVDLPVGGRAVVRYSGTVADSAPAGAVVVNTALTPVSGQSDTTSHPVRGAAAPAQAAGPVIPPPAPPRRSGPLAITGADLAAVVLAGAGGITVGGVLLLAARRRRDASAVDPQAA